MHVFVVTVGSRTAPRALGAAEVNRWVNSLRPSTLRTSCAELCDKHSVTEPAQAAALASGLLDNAPVGPELAAQAVSFFAGLRRPDFDGRAVLEAVLQHTLGLPRDQWLGEFLSRCAALHLSFASDRRLFPGPGDGQLLDGLARNHPDCRMPWPVEQLSAAARQALSAPGRQGFLAMNVLDKLNDPGRASGQGHHTAAARGRPDAGYVRTGPPVGAGPRRGRGRKRPPAGHAAGLR